MIAVCGTGHGGHVLAAIAGSAHPGEVGWLTSDPARARALGAALAGGGLAATGALERAASRLRGVSADPAEVVAGAHLVLVVVPASAHRATLARVAPHLRDDATLVVLPARGGLEFEVDRLLPGMAPAGRRRVLGLQTLPWLCRVREPGRRVEVAGVKRAVLAAGLPAAAAPALASPMSRLLGTDIVPAPSFLTLTLGNPGQVLHPVCLFALFEHAGGVRDRTGPAPRLYADLDERGAALLEAVSAEIVAVARAIEEAAGGRLDLGGVQPIGRWLETAYGEAITDASTLRACVRTNRAYAGVPAPARETSPGVHALDPGHRFLTEDVPYGLVVVRALAELAGVATPWIDEIITWAQRILRAEYLAGGRLRGRDLNTLRLPRHAGIDSLPALVRAFT